MSLYQNIKTLGRFIFDLVFPVVCVNCGRDGVHICEVCIAKVEKLTNQWCIVCQKPTPYGKTHEACVSRNKADGSVSALNYKDVGVKKIIKAFKFKFIEPLSLTLTNFLVQEIQTQGLEDHFQDFVLIPVPLHKKRFNWRGFNQSELLANLIAEKLKLPIDLTLVQRIKNTKPQTKLKGEERKNNLINAFALKKPSVQDGKFLIVDDVLTTGSTINEIAKLLKKAGASETWAITVAHG